MHRPPDLATLRRALRQQRRQQQGGSTSHATAVLALQSAEGVAAETEAHSREDATYAALPLVAAPVDLQVSLPYPSLFASSCFRLIAAQQCAELSPRMPSHDCTMFFASWLGHDDQPLKPHRESILCQRSCCNDRSFDRASVLPLPTCYTGKFESAGPSVIGGTGTRTLPSSQAVSACVEALVRQGDYAAALQAASAALVDGDVPNGGSPSQADGCVPGRDWVPDPVARLLLQRALCYR